jgi:hypothetical protein
VARITDRTRMNDETRVRSGIGSTSAANASTCSPPVKAAAKIRGTLASQDHCHGTPTRLLLELIDLPGDRHTTDAYGSCERACSPERLRHSPMRRSQPVRDTRTGGRPVPERCRPGYRGVS